MISFSPVVKQLHFLNHNVIYNGVTLAYPIICVTLKLAYSHNMGNQKMIYYIIFIVGLHTENNFLQKISWEVFFPSNIECLRSSSQLSLLNTVIICTIIFMLHVFKPFAKYMKNVLTKINCHFHLNFNRKVNM